MRALLFCLCLLAGNAWGADWYVRPDTQGEYGLEDGTDIDNAFDGNADIAWASINAGDTLYLCGDWVAADARFTIADSGSVGNYITLSGDATACGRSANSTIDRTGLTGAGARAIAASNTAATRQYIRIEDLTIRNVSAGILWDHSTTGAVTDDTSLWVRRVAFENCGTASGTDGNCIWKRGEGLIVEDSTFDGCWEDCIWYRGKGATITDNTYTNVSFGNDLGDCTQVDLTGVTDSGAVTWSDNYCDHQAADNKYGFVIGATAGAGSSVTVEDNTVLCPLVPTNPLPSKQCHPIYFDTATETAIVARRNFTQGGEVGISLTAESAAPFSTRARIEANVVYKASDRGIWTDDNVNNIDIWNNTISEAGQEALYIGDSSASSVNANNNTLINSASGLFYIGTPTSRGYNAYSGNAVNVDVNGTPGSTTTGDVTADPQFVGGGNPTDPGGFKTRSTSPLRRSGTCVYTTGCVPRDFGGRRTRVPPDIGAWQSGAD